MNRLIAYLVVRVSLITILVCVFTLTGCRGEDKPDNTRKFDLKTGENTTFEFNFTKGNKVEIWFNSEGTPDMAVSLYQGEKGKGNFITQDIGNEGYVRFIPQASGPYGVKVTNLSEEKSTKNGPAKGLVTVSEVSPDKGWGKPGGLRPASGQTRNFDLNVNRKATFYIPFTEGKKVEVTVKSEGESDVDLFVYDENHNLIKSDEDPSQHCYVEFIAPATQEYEVVIWNRQSATVQHFGAPPQFGARNGPNRGVLTFKDSQPDAVNMRNSQNK